jgi:GntR family histidine utilization transcriptional repressor
VPVLSARPLGLERRIRAELEARIRDGSWPPGHRIPTEAALMAEYGCARMTVHKAITALASAGLVTRNKRAGTLVAKPPVVTAVLEIPDIAALIAARGEVYEFQLLSREIRPLRADDGAEAALAPRGEVLALTGAHMAAGEPFGLESRVINLATAPEARDRDFTVEAPGSWLLHHAPWTDGRHRITAVAAEATQARRLGVARGAACLQIERWTWRAGAGVTFVRQIFPGDRYDLVAEFSPPVAT